MGYGAINACVRTLSCVTWDPTDRYGTDVLASYSRRRGPTPLPEVEAAWDVVVEHLESDFCGSVVRVEAGTVELEDRHGRKRTFPLGPGFLFEGVPVRLVPPKNAVHHPVRTASGSIKGPQQRARVARASRIFVEGRHDAELVEKVWGDDLRGEGIVIEMLDGIDNLAHVLDEFQPGPERRAGVLVDHLVAGSKESRIAAQIGAGRYSTHVLVLGHPFVDVWQSVTPRALGIPAWPVVGREVEWKVGICRAFGWPADTQADIARAWQHILSRVSNYTDLEPELLGRVEELIDFVTLPSSS